MDSKIDLKKYIIGHESVEFTYQQVYKDALYSDNSNEKSSIKDKLT